MFSYISRNSNTSTEQAQDFPCPALVHPQNNCLTETLFCRKLWSYLHAHAHNYTYLYTTQVFPFDPSTSKTFLKKGKTEPYSAFLYSGLQAKCLLCYIDDRYTTRLQQTQDGAIEGDHWGWLCNTNVMEIAARPAPGSLKQFPGFTYGVR